MELNNNSSIVAASTRISTSALPQFRTGFCFVMRNLGDFLHQPCCLAAVLVYLCSACAHTASAAYPCALCNDEVVWPCAVTQQPLYSLHAGRRHIYTHIPQATILQHSFPRRWAEAAAACISSTAGRGGRWCREVDCKKAGAKNRTPRGAHAAPPSHTGVRFKIRSLRHAKKMANGSCDSTAVVALRRPPTDRVVQCIVLSTVVRFCGSRLSPSRSRAKEAVAATVG